MIMTTRLYIISMSAAASAGASIDASTNANISADPSTDASADPSTDASAKTSDYARDDIHYIFLTRDDEEDSLFGQNSL